jgi:glutaredoxin
MPELTVYTLEDCPNCEKLKDALAREGIPFRVASLMDPAALTELRINAVFPQEAPVLQIDDDFYESPEIFAGGEVRESVLDRVRA